MNQDIVKNQGKGYFFNNLFSSPLKVYGSGYARNDSGTSFAKSSANHLRMNRDSMFFGFISEKLTPRG